MNRSHAVANRFREVILYGTWIANTNFKDQLTQIPFDQVSKKVSGLNTIALLAQHIHYYIQGINQVLLGGTLDIKDKYSFDFPELTSEKNWHDFLTQFWLDAELFAEHVEQLNDEQLDAIFTDAKYGTFSRNLEGMIEHSYYHLGQIVLIRKWIESAK